MANPSFSLESRGAQVPTVVPVPPLAIPSADEASTSEAREKKFADRQRRLKHTVDVVRRREGKKSRFWQPFKFLDLLDRNAT